MAGADEVAQFEVEPAAIDERSGPSADRRGRTANAAGQVKAGPAGKRRVGAENDGSSQEHCGGRRKLVDAEPGGAVSCEGKSIVTKPTRTTCR